MMALSIVNSSLAPSEPVPILADTPDSYKFVRLTDTQYSVELETMQATVVVVCVLAALVAVEAGVVDLRRKRSPQQRYGNFGHGHGPVVQQRPPGFPGGYSNQGNRYQGPGFQQPGLIGGGFNQQRPIKGGYNPGFGGQPSFSGSQSQSSSSSQSGGGGRGGQSGSSSSSSSQSFNSGGGRGGLSGSSSQSSSNSLVSGGGGRRPGNNFSGSQSSSSSNSFSGK